MRTCGSVLVAMLSAVLWAEAVRPPVMPDLELRVYTEEYDQPEKVFNWYAHEYTLLQNDDGEQLEASLSKNSIAPYVNTTMACYALMQNRPKCLAVLIKHGFNPENFSERGDTPMVFAARMGYVEVIRVLAAAGADVNRSAAKGHTNPLIAACEFGQVATAKALIELGADVNYFSNTRWSPLASASLYDREDVIELLLAHGADINRAEKLYNKTPLMVAADLNATRCLKVLLAHGADKEAKSVDDWSAADFTYWRNYQDSADALKILMEAGVKLNRGISAKELWPLRLMAEHHATRCLEYVLSLKQHNLTEDGDSLYYCAMRKRGCAKLLRVLHEANVPTRIMKGTYSSGEKYHQIQHEIAPLLDIWLSAEGADKESLETILAFAKERGESLELDLFKVSLGSDTCVEKVRWMLECGAKPHQRKEGATFRDFVRKKIEQSGDAASLAMINILAELDKFWPDDNLNRELTVRTCSNDWEKVREMPKGEALPLNIQLYPSKQAQHVLLKLQNNDKNTTFTFDQFKLPICQEGVTSVPQQKQFLALPNFTLPAGETRTFLLQFAPKDFSFALPNSAAVSQVSLKQGFEYWVDTSFNAEIDGQRWSYSLRWENTVTRIGFRQTLPGSFKIVRVVEGEE